MNSGIKTSGNLAAKSSNFSTSKDTKLGSRNERIAKGVSVLKKGLWKKVLIGFGITAGAVEATNETVAGIMWAKGKKSDSIPKGKYSFMNLFRSKIKKDDRQPDDPGEPGKKNPGKKIDDKKDDKTAEDKYKEKENLDDIKKIKDMKISNIVSSNSIQNQQQSINVMRQMVNKIPQSLPDVQKFGNWVLEYLKYLMQVQVTNPNGLDAQLLSYVASGKGVITDCNYFCDHGIWCFGIEVTYNENNGTKKGYVYLAPCLKMENGLGGVKAWATADFQSRLVKRWPDSNARGPAVCGNFVAQQRFQNV